jgi:hypothetical protein
MYAVRHRDGRTSWSHGLFNEKLGYCIKYKPEYISSLIPKAMIAKPDEWTLRTTAAFFMVSNWINAIDEFARFKIALIRNQRLKQLLIRLFYGTLLSDRFFEQVYPRLAALLASTLSLLPTSLCRKELRNVGFLDPFPGRVPATLLPSRVAIP